jgi:hypothetical protein
MASVILLAGIAAVVSYRHMHALALAHGESGWTSALVPLSVDGMVVASSMTLLADSRTGRRGGVLPWVLLASGSAASLAANMAVAEPTLYGRLIAAWPSFALVGAYELLMRQVRHAAAEAVARVRRPAGAGGGSGRGVGASCGVALEAGLSARPVFGRRRRAAAGHEVGRPDSELLARARQVDAAHWAQRGRPASAETLRVQLRVGAASARGLKDLLRGAPGGSSPSPVAPVAPVAG